MSMSSNHNKNNQLILTINNGDKEKFEDCLKDWKFKDEQSMLRFLMSIMIESYDKQTLAIYNKQEIDKLVRYAPADQLINKASEDE